MGHVEKVAEQDPGCDRGMKLDVDQIRSQATPQKTCNLDRYFRACGRSQEEQLECIMHV